MRRKIVAGNWKMFGSRASVTSLIAGIKQGVDQVDVLVFPTYLHIPLVAELLKDSSVKYGAQNMYLGESGAFTGEVSAPMLVDYECTAVLIGHSERRQLFHEDLDLIAAKFKMALQFGLQPILCVGETLAQREKGETQDIIRQQLVSVIDLAGIEAFEKAVIAYEPVWAIGTGLTATPIQAQEVHEFIRQELAKYHINIANCTRILYGGSVKADNAAGLFAMPDIDGALVGGASLDAKSFLAICQAGK
jgi:triosephosphate isomerase